MSAAEWTSRGAEGGVADDRRPWVPQFDDWQQNTPGTWHRKNARDMAQRLAIGEPCHVPGVIFPRSYSPRVAPFALPATHELFQGNASAKLSARYCITDSRSGDATGSRFDRSFDIGEVSSVHGLAGNEGQPCQVHPMLGGEEHRMVKSPGHVDVDR